ncbi:MAG: YhdP family protein [Rhodanobacteraceae bacterium]
MSPWRHHVRRARFAAITLVAAVIIAAAVAMAITQMLLPLATYFPDFVARQLSARLHRPVRFAAITSVWQPAGPLVTVRGLTLGAATPGGQSITLPHAALKFDFSAWLRPEQRWITLRLSDMDLRVERTSAGWQVAGFGNSPGTPHASLQSLPVNLDLRDLRVDIVDDVGHRSWQLFAPRVRVINVGDVVRFGGSVKRLDTDQAITVSGRMNAAKRDYSLYASTRGLDLAAAMRGLAPDGCTVQGGRGDVALWATWRGGKLESAIAHYDVRDLAASGPDGRHIAPESLVGVFQARRVDGGWNFALRGPRKARANIDGAGGAVAELRGHSGAWQVAVAAHAVDGGPWLSWLAIVPQVPAALSNWVSRARPQLQVDSAALAWHQGGAYDAVVRFSGLHATASGTWPGVELSRGILRADNHALSLELPRQAANIALTHVFRRPFVLDALAGTLVAWREDGQWNVAADGLQFDTGSLAGSAHAHLVWLGHGHRPFLAAYATLDRATVADATLFWPYRSMPQPLITWLDRALIAGEVTSGRVVLRGDLDDWPFIDHRGRFEAAGQVHDATFDFANDWPRATEVDAMLDFVDNRMDITATHAKVAGVTATHAVAAIPDLGHGVLGLDIRGGGTGAELLDFVRYSPVGAGALDALNGLTIGGTGKFGIQLSIPLKQAQDFTLGGTVDLARADVTAAKWNLALKNLNGPLSIAGKGFRANDLSATFHGAPATLSLAVGSGVADPQDRVEASMDTRVSAQTLVEGYPDLDGLVAHASGVAPFHVAVTVPIANGNAAATPILDVTSSLAGIALDFPAPLDKPAETQLPLHVRLALPPAGAPLTVSLGGVLQVRGRLADAARQLPIALALDFGDTPPAGVPASGMVVGGHAARLDINGWIQQALGASSGNAFPQLENAHVTTDAAEVFGMDLGALKFSYTAGTASNSIRFDGPAAQGTVEVPSSGVMTHGITAHLAYLHLPEPPPSAKSAPPKPPSAASPIAPAAVPPLDVSIADFELGHAKLGATTFASVPTLDGMHVSAFDSTARDFSIRARGDWNGTMARSQSHFVVDIASRDFGGMLVAFGFSGLVAGGNDAQVHINGTWPGGPSGFSFAWMDGTLGVKVGEGRLLAVKPGLGRLLGLLSLRELPSRLMLRFGDVFKSGFAFNHASGTFSLKDGSAYTHDLLIQAPAARITMRGRTGFRARDFDLNVEVIPHVGGTLPVVGAVIGGPVGAAAGLVVQGLVGEGINRAVGSAYRVTGSWDKPTIVAASAAMPAAAASAALPVPAPSSSAPPAPGSSAAPASGD